MSRVRQGEWERPECHAETFASPRLLTLVLSHSYTSAFNLFDLPSLVFPTGISVNAEADMAFEASEGSDSPSRSKVNNADTGDWDRENEEEYVRHRDVYEGAPVGLQLVGSRFEEVSERTLSLRPGDVEM